MHTGGEMQRAGVVRFRSHARLQVALLFCVATQALLHARTSQQVADSHPPDPVAELKKSDDLEPFLLEQSVRDHRIDAIPVLEEKFAATRDNELKAHIASALLRLGADDSAFWDFLLDATKTAVQSDAPSAFEYDSEGKMRPSAQFQTWVEANHIPKEKAFEDEVYHRPGIVLFLGITGDRRGIALLRQALNSSNYLIRSNAARGLAKIGDRDSIPLIIDACKSAPRDAAVTIAWALAYFDDPTAQAAAQTFLSKPFRDALIEHPVRGTDPFR